MFDSVCCDHMQSSLRVIDLTIEESGFIPAHLTNIPYMEVLYLQNSPTLPLSSTFKWVYDGLKTCTICGSESSIRGFMREQLAVSFIDQRGSTGKFLAQLLAKREKNTFKCPDQNCSGRCNVKYKTVSLPLILHLQFVSTSDNIPSPTKIDPVVDFEGRRYVFVATIDGDSTHFKNRIIRRGQLLKYDGVRTVKVGKAKSSWFLPLSRHFDEAEKSQAWSGHYGYRVTKRNIVPPSGTSFLILFFNLLFLWNYNYY